jgi:transposase InsO family protein
MALVQAIRTLAEQHPRYGYRPITALLKRDGWPVNHKRVQRLWRQEGLQLPRRKPRKQRVGTSTGEVFRATRKNQVWSYDFLEARTERGGRLRMLAVMDEYTRQCLAIEVARSLPSQRVIQVLSWLFLVQGTPEQLRSDNGPEFVARAVQRWLAHHHCQTMYITPGSPWENPFIESFIGKLRDECLNRYLFANGREAQHIVEQWRIEYNTFRPHSSLGYLTPVEFAQQQHALSLQLAQT